MTTDNGKTWRRTPFAGRSFTGLWGRDPNDVFAVGDGALLRSDDSGSTWIAPALGDDAAAALSAHMTAVAGNAGMIVHGRRAYRAP